MAVELNSSTIDKLIEASMQVKLNAYCRYSNFRVGAALLCHDGTIVPGCNVENVAHSPGLCAERAAIGHAVSRGYRQFIAIAIASDMKEAWITPCGACRQALAEFGLDWSVYMTKPDKSYVVKTVRELLPMPFEPSALQAPRISDSPSNELTSS